MYELTPTCFLVWTVLLSVLLKWSQAEVYTSENNPEVKNTILATAFICSKGSNRNNETLELEAEPGPSSQEISSIQNQAWTLEGSADFWTYRWPCHYIIIILTGKKKSGCRGVPVEGKSGRSRTSFSYHVNTNAWMFLSGGEAVQIKKRLAHSREARVMPWWQEAPGKGRRLRTEGSTHSTSSSWWQTHPGPPPQNHHHLPSLPHKFAIQCVKKWVHRGIQVSGSTNISYPYSSTLNITFN